MLTRKARLQSRSGLKRSPMRKVSKRKAKLNRELAKTKRDAMRETDGVCELQIPGVCTWFAVDPHHTKKQSQHTDNSRRNVKMACRPCHNWCHANHAEAVKRGYIKERRAA